MTNEKKSEPSPEHEEKERAVRARHELNETLDAIEYRLNFPQRFAQATRKKCKHLRAAAVENPGVAVVVGLAVGTAAIAAVVGVGLLIRSLSKPKCDCS